MINLGAVHVPCPTCGHDIPVTGRISGNGLDVHVQVNEKRLSETVAAHLVEHHSETGSR